MSADSGHRHLGHRRTPIGPSDHRHHAPRPSPTPPRWRPSCAPPRYHQREQQCTGATPRRRLRPAVHSLRSDGGGADGRTSWRSAGRWIWWQGSARRVPGGGVWGACCTCNAVSPYCPVWLRALNGAPSVLAPSPAAPVQPIPVRPCVMCWERSHSGRRALFRRPDPRSDPALW